MYTQLSQFFFPSILNPDINIEFKSIENINFPSNSSLHLATEQ